MSEKKDFICVSRVDHDGKMHEENAPISLSQEQAEPLLAAGAIKPKAAQAPAPAKQTALLGSGILPAEIEIVEGKVITLGDLVGAAFDDSGLDIEGWNELDEEAREQLLTLKLEAIKADAAGKGEHGRYHAEHRGAGRWYVIDETTGEAAEGTEAMKRDDAEALAEKMNAEASAEQ